MCFLDQSRSRHHIESHKILPQLLLQEILSEHWLVQFIDQNQLVEILGRVTALNLNEFTNDADVGIS